MTDDFLNYGHMMQRALRAVMFDALSQVAKHGLLGEHHFYITFDTTHDAVEMPNFLRESYPEEITIVLQHEFSDLSATPSGFGVRMSFSGRPATLYVPFDAVTTFVDPSVEFGLKFEVTESDEIEDEPDDDTPAPKPQGESTSAEVVSLDQFRKQ